MSLSEFDLIERFFKRPLKNPFNRIGIGDDCALIKLPESLQLAVTTDTMVQNVHFFEHVSAQDLGHKLLAVNLSDLASMGAQPFAITLALTMPSVDEKWLNDFAEGLFNLADLYSIDLIGGDTTKGHLTLTLQALGYLPNHLGLRRNAAQAGDLICVTGSIGDAGLGLKILQGHNGNYSAQPLNRFHRPLAKINEGLAIRHLAHACIDISDGLAADLTHILQKSSVGAIIDYDTLPLSTDVKTYIAMTDDWQLPLIAGEDYELCFTIKAEDYPKLTIHHKVIGMIEAEPGLRILRHGQLQTLQVKGFEHFS
ncbi:MAG: hypothetical protein RL637_1108 [Pseudomonadota bacterium]|jgi:thiamine-monophosphate kinase